MREFLFRGKKDDGTWSSGYYVHLHDSKGRESHRIYPGYAETDCGDYYPDWDEVDSSTLGLFTGLVDKDGVKIFEGDIVRDEQSFLFGKVVYATPQDGFDGLAGFMVDDVDDGLQNYNGFWHNVEVVGNIHDNPELIGGAKC